MQGEGALFYAPRAGASFSPYQIPRSSPESSERSATPERFSEASGAPRDARRHRRPTRCASAASAGSSAGASAASRETSCETSCGRSESSADCRRPRRQPQSACADTTVASDALPGEGPRCSRDAEFCDESSGRVSCRAPPEPQLCEFCAIVTPLQELAPHGEGHAGSVEFRMRRKNKTVTLQWEPFRGLLAASGVPFLTVAQALANVPPYPVTGAVFLKYKDAGRVTHAAVVPGPGGATVRFYLNADGGGSGVQAGDAVEVAGGTLTWIVV